MYSDSLFMGKTVSRWETGTYLPSADEEYKQAAENNLTQTIRESSFTLKDKLEFYKKKWLKEHIAIMVFVGICIVDVFVAAFVVRNSLLVYIAILMFILAHGWRNSEGNS